MKKQIFAILAVVLVCAMLAGCVNTPEQPANINTAQDTAALVGNIPVSFPLVSTPKTLQIMVTGSGEREPETVYVWQKYKEMTGVDVNWTNVTKETRTEAYHIALTNRQQLDLILRCKVSATQLLRYGKSGLILDLAKDGMLQKYAPNCWAYLHSHPDTLASTMNPDGTIYALPQVNAGPELRVGVKLFVNKLWLERVNMELPTTTEDLRTLLTAFKEQDANGNGDPDDEIPLCSVDWSSTQLALYGAFGLANRGFHNTTVDCDPVTGGTRLIEGCEEYRAYLTYLRDLYANGLIDDQMFTITTDEWLAHIDNDRVGMFAMTNLAWIPADKLDQWVAVDEALTGPAGDKLWSAIRANFHSTGAAVIPATCSDPALVLQWLDYFWTDEGTLFYHMGVEGETYTKHADGSYDYLPKIYDEMNAANLSFDDAIRAYSPYPGGSNPTVEIAPYFMGGEMAEVPAEAAKALMAYGPEEYWPSFTFTQEENDTLDGIKSDMSKYCNSMRIDFITGTRSLDEWDAYKTELNRMGADQMLHVYQAAVDRYHALITVLNDNS